MRAKTDGRNRAHRREVLTSKAVLLLTADQFIALPDKQQTLLTRVANAITNLRGGTSLRQSARKAGIDPRTVTRLGRSALRKGRNGRYAAKRVDHLPRLLIVQREQGKEARVIAASRQATLVGEYWNAIEAMVSGDDDSKLKLFDGKYVVDANGEQIPFVTDKEVIKRLAYAAELRFETVYVK